MKHIIPLFLLFLLIACRADSDKRAAENLLQRATEQYEKAQYAEARATIDSIRKTYPKEIDVRVLALSLYQQVSLKEAQQNLEEIDSALQAAESQYKEMKKTVDRHKEEGRATEKELTALTLQRMRRNNLKSQFDWECAKIKDIKKKMGK